MDGWPERATPAAAAGEQPARRWRELETARRQARELDAFCRSLAQRRPRATFALMVAIALVFGLEALWGGVDLPPLLSAMGSLVPERARAGQWWRFFACSFLHGGPLHVGLNLLVLWMLGRSLERVIGTSRFLIIYFCAALAGSVASSCVVEGQSVGASGAIWGLLGAEAALAFYPRPLLPWVLIPVARRSALLNLGINLLASFVPRVDVAAHIGGGVAGALMLLLLARSSPLPAEAPAPRPIHVGLRGLAATLAVVFAIGLLTAWCRGEPWQLAVPPELERAPVPHSPWSAELPRGYAVALRAGDAGGIEAGDLRHDPSMIQMQWAPLADDTARAALEDELAELERELSAVNGLEVLAAPRLFEERAGAYIGVRYRHAESPEIIDDWAIGTLQGSRLRVHVSGWAALARASDGLALRILRSVEPAPVARDGAVLHRRATAAR